MRSFALVLTGIAAGFVVGHFAPIKKNAPEPAVQTNTSPTAEIPNPFATVTKPAVSPNESDTTAQALQPANSEVTQAQHSFPTAPAADISHYRDLAAYLQHIETLDAQQLETLLDQFKNTGHQASFSHTLASATYQRWAELDTDSAVQHAIDSLESRLGYGNEISRYAITLLSAEYPDIISNKAAELATGNPHSQLQYLVSEGIAAKDPEQFLRNLLETESTNSNQPDMAMMALMKWAEKDPAAAWDFINTEDAQRFESYHRENILSTWFYQDPDAALPIIEAELNNNSNGLRPEQMMLIDLYTRHIAQDNPEAAIQWAFALSNHALRQQALSVVFSNTESIDANSLISLIDQLTPQEKNTVLPMAVSSIANNLASTDPQAALQWADQLPPQQRDEAQFSAVTTWSIRDPEAATAWVLSQPDTQQNQTLIQSSLMAVIHTNLESATLLYENLPANMQLQMLDPMMSVLAQRGPDAVTQWLSEQSNPDIQTRGAILVDLINPQSDTYTTLDKIIALQTPDQEDLLFRFLSERSYTDPGTVTQWVSETNSLTPQQREIAEQMIGTTNGRFGSPYELFLQNREQ